MLEEETLKTVEKSIISYCQKQVMNPFKKRVHLDF